MTGGVGFEVLKIERVVEFQDAHGDTWSEISYEIIDHLEDVIDISWVLFGVLPNGEVKPVSRQICRENALQMAQWVANSGGAKIEICPSRD